MGIGQWLGRLVLIVASVPMADQKAVLATVESLNIVPARARSGGTVGQVIAVVADAKLLLQIAAIDARADQGGTEILYAATGFEKI